MKRIFIVGFATGIFLMGTFGLSNANLLINGSFESNTNLGNFWTLFAGNSSLPGWSITSGSVDWIQDYWDASDGDKSLDLNGSSAGTILSDSFSTIIGQQYDVTFDMAGNYAGGMDEKHLTVSAGGSSQDFSFDTTGHSSSDMGWETMTWSFTATSTQTQLQFSGWTSDGPYNGAALDNVIVLEANSPNPVPEPATLLMFGTGLAGLAGWRKRKNG